MILSKTVQIKICGHVTYYEKLGYVIPKFKYKNGRLHVKQDTLLDVKIEHLPKSSIAKVLVKCDECGKERYLNFRDYTPLCNSCRQTGIRNHMFGKVGKLHHCFNPNITNQERLERRSDTASWKRKIKKRDNYTCQYCGYVGEPNDGIMIAHHFNSYWLFKEQRTDIDNGICLCVDCHKSFHNLYGSFTERKDWEEFIQF